MANCNYFILSTDCPGFADCPHDKNKNNIKNLKKYLLKRKRELEPYILGSASSDFKWQMINEILEEIERE